AAPVSTVYGDHAPCGPPDHIQVHRVGVRAGELAGTPRGYEATSNRDHMRRMMVAAREAGMDVADRFSDEEVEAFGSPESDITTVVDVSDYLDRKRAAMAAHAS